MCLKLIWRNPKTKLELKMNYYSLNNIAPNTTFETAVIKGLAPDKGLYFPENITALDPSFFDTIETLSNEEIAYEAIKQFISPEIPEAVLKTIVSETLNFDFPVVKLTDSISTLELFHGPTMAFKDVGARFMARCLGYFNKNNSNEVTVLVGHIWRYRWGSCQWVFRGQRRKSRYFIPKWESE